MRIAIVDDERQDREMLAELAAACCEQLRLPCDLFPFTDGRAFLNKFTQGAYDVVLLDIYMDGLNGMETARAVRQVDKQVHLVFVTVTAQYALESYDLRATHYLVKPPTRQAMEAALRVCIERNTLNERFITVKEGYQVHNVLLRNILHTSKGRNTVVLHTTRGDITMYASYLKFAPQLLEDMRFVQCGYGVIVNLEHVSRMEKEGLVLDGGTLVHVPRRERERVRSAWASYEVALQKERWGS